jgi:hypothetical protein
MPPAGLAISGLNIGDTLYARIEPANNVTSSLFIVDESLNSTTYSANRASGIVNQSPQFTLSSGGIYRIDAFLEPAPIVLRYRHDSIDYFTILRNGDPIYQSTQSLGGTWSKNLNYTTLQIYAYQPGDTITINGCSTFSRPQISLEVTQGSTLINGISTGDPSCTSISFIAQSGIYSISAYIPGITVFDNPGV